MNKIIVTEKISGMDCIEIGGGKFECLVNENGSNLNFIGIIKYGLFIFLLLVFILDIIFIIKLIISLIKKKENL